MKNRLRAGFNLKVRGERVTLKRHPRGIRYFSIQARHYLKSVFSLPWRTLETTVTRLKPSARPSQKRP